MNLSMGRACAAHRQTGLGGGAISMTAFEVRALQEFACACFKNAGVDHEDADWTANVLMTAEARGKSTHGVSRLSDYVKALLRGKINSSPHREILQTSPVSTLVQGDNGLGPPAAREGMISAMKAAFQYGVGVSTVQSGNHVGILACYTELAADEGLVGMAFTNAQPAIPPSGGKRAFFGTNPMALAAGMGNHRVSIDMATSTVARGNIIMAAKRGDSIPEGWAIDAEGHDTTDPNLALLGAVLPMAGAKGYALALGVDVLSGVLSGAQFGNQVGSIYDRDTEPAGTGMFFMALDPAFFVGRKVFVERMTQLARNLTQSPKASGVERIYLPGQRAREVEVARRMHGVFINAQLMDELNGLSETLGVPLLNRIEGTPSV
ncbi:Ldh family oxidoreductase [Alicyclobacillaceae bacterium I2511]|nr:Ldh family oxidoreductase [Alicyclobacillaceae bacterium I2511]